MGQKERSIVLSCKKRFIRFVHPDPKKRRTLEFGYMKRIMKFKLEGGGR